jgi:hypothetical protein
LEERFIFSIRRVRYVLTVFTDSDSVLGDVAGGFALGQLQEHLELALGQLLVRRAASSLRLSCCASSSATAGEM